MSDKIEPSTHIDILVIRNLIISRLNEGRDMMKLANIPTSWKKKERIFQEKCMQAVKLIDEAVKAKEGKFNEVSNQTTGEGNKSAGKADIQK